VVNAAAVSDVTVATTTGSTASKATAPRLAVTGTDSDDLMRYGIMSMLLGLLLVALSNAPAVRRRR